MLGKWLAPGIGIKRWLVVLVLGIFTVALSVSVALLKVIEMRSAADLLATINWLQIVLGVVAGLAIVGIAILRASRAILEPYRRSQPGTVIDRVYTHNKLRKGVRVVAVGGGSGLPAVLRGLKTVTSNLTAVVTVADDGGSSGRLRRELGVLPPGDLRNNIAALADDESLMTRLFQYRFHNGDLEGHAFGNLFITALSGVSGSLESALLETERVLNITGRVLPSTLAQVHLTAQLRVDDHTEAVTIVGESKITTTHGKVERIALDPPNVEAYSESVRAIREADLVIIGPGSLYTSLLPNLLVKGIAEALRATSAYKIYVCNVAMQPGETEGYGIAEHVMALEKHIGRGIFQVIVANNATPPLPNGEPINYVTPVPSNHEILQRYDVRYFDLIDSERPWRHDPEKLVNAILSLSAEERMGGQMLRPLFADALPVATPTNKQAANNHPL